MNRSWPGTWMLLEVKCLENKDSNDVKNNESTDNHNDNDSDNLMMVMNMEWY